MKKTQFTMLVISGVCGTEKYRRVWEDAEGRYFVKIDGEVRDVTYAKDWFIED